VDAIRQENETVNLDNYYTSEQMDNFMSTYLKNVREPLAGEFIR
jgi:hypothetical protein